MKWYIVINILAYIGISGIIYYVSRCFGEWDKKLEDKEIYKLKYYIVKLSSYFFYFFMVVLVVPLVFMAINEYLFKRGFVRLNKLPEKEIQELLRYYDK